MFVSQLMRQIKLWIPGYFPIAWKLAIVFTMLITAGMASLGYFIAKDQTRVLDQQIRGFSNTIAGQMAEFTKDPLLANDTLSLELIVNNMIGNEGIVGAAIFSEEKETIGAAGIIPSASIYDSGKRKQTIEWSYPANKSNLKQMISFVSPVIYDDILVGHTLITFDRGILDLVREKIIKAIIAATVLMIIVSILASFILGQRLTRPIHQLMHASRAISEGDYEFRFDNMRKDEIGRLMGSMNEMTEGLLRKEQVEQTFSRYVSPKVAKEVLKNLSKVKLGGEQVHASVIFADIVGFTSLSEKLPPDQVNKLLNEYFSHIAQVAHHYGGYIDKFIGDCVMIVFGVPEKDEKHALHATQCAVMIDMMVRMLNKEREASNQTPVKFRIGINCGMMLAGNMGSSDRMEYTVVGDAVNLSARLSSAAGPGQIYISEYLYEEIKDDSYFIIENVGPIELKGKSKSVTTYSIQDVNDEYLSEMMKVLNKYITPQRIEYA